GVDGRLPAFQQLLAEADTERLRAVDQLRCELSRRLLAQHLLDEWMIRSERLAHLRQRERQSQLLKLGIDWCSRELWLLQRLGFGLGKFRKSQLIRLLVFNRVSQQGQRVAEQTGVERSAAH